MTTFKAIIITVNGVRKSKNVANGMLNRIFFVYYSIYTAANSLPKARRAFLI